MGVKAHGDAAPLAYIGKYRIDAVLGRGAMGVVYRAWDADAVRAVALKTVQAELPGGPDQSQLLARFSNEVQACAGLAHPNIVALYEHGQADGIVFMALELVDGASLGTVLQDVVPMEPDAYVRAMGQLLDALGHAHAHGVVHRDVKPANILIGHDKELKLGDFGIAQIGTPVPGATLMPVGTPSFMSPEQLRGEVVDGRCDLFAAGIVLYQMLTGVSPFAGTSSVVMDQIANHTPPAPSQLRAGLHPAFDGVLRQALAKQAGQRFASAHHFHDALLAAHAQQGSAP